MEKKIKERNEFTGNPTPSGLDVRNNVKYDDKIRMELSDTKDVLMGLMTHLDEYGLNGDIISLLIDLYQKKREVVMNVDILNDIQFMTNFMVRVIIHLYNRNMVEEIPKIKKATTSIDNLINYDVDNLLPIINTSTAPSGGRKRFTEDIERFKTCIQELS